MKHLLAIFSIVILSSTACAQAPEYKDLRILYADATYDSYKKLVKQAEKYTLKDKTKKDIPPYFWLAKGLYKISQSGTDDEQFKNAYKNGIKFLGKGIKYDLKYNDGAYTIEEQEFVSEFQLSLYETINNEISAGSFRRGVGWAIKYLKVTTNPVGAQYVLGACKHSDGDKTTARDYWKEGDKLLNEIESIENWSEADKNMLKIGILYSAAALKKSRQGDKANTLVGKAAQWFENDEDWEILYDEIVNNVGQ